MKVLFHFMHNPCPARTGAHRRCLWMLQNFVSSGADVVLASSTTHTEQPWSEEAKRALLAEGLTKVCVYEHTLFTRAVNRWERRSAANAADNELYREQMCEPSYKRWFRRLVEKESPDLIVMNYAWFDQLMQHGAWSSIRRAIETHDILSVNKAYRDHACKQLAARAAGAAPEQVYNLQLMKEIPVPNVDSEMQIYDQYNLTIAISGAEDAILKAKLKESEVGLVPIGEVPRDIKNTYSEGILLAMGPNPFNQLALGFFCEQVWPKAHKLNPKIKAFITGSVQPPCPIPEGIQHLGFVSNLSQLFETVRFAVSPVFIGTGQQVKIVEYLANGLGVVALDVPTVSPLLKNGKSGLVVKDAAEMAEAIAALYDDVDRCRRYGTTAKEIIQQDFQNNTSFKKAFFQK
jgi:glycosyltransferase involved in cell wall biosynthesis